MGILKGTWKLYTPLYTLESGLMGFRCLCSTHPPIRSCTFMCAREQDMKRHLWMKHKIRVQMEFQYAKPESNPAR